jgi:PAS domain S-box-containing protein
MKTALTDRPTLFYGLRLRHAIALLIVLIVILVLAGYFSVSAGQKAALQIVVAQGRALTETMLSSAGMVIESDDAITRLAIDNLIRVVGVFDVKQGFKSDAILEVWKDSLNADKVALIANKKIRASSSTRDSFLNNDEIQGWLDSLKIDPEAEIVYDFRNVGADRYFWGYFAVDDTTGIFAGINWKYGQYGNAKLSLYYLLNEVGRESGVEYVMLQNEDGIVFASKMVGTMPGLKDDQFLVASLTSDTTRSRIIRLENRSVLETVKKFQSGDLQGIFRVGLSLFNYRQIANGVRRQVWLVVAALLLIGIIGFGVIVGFQNFEILKSGLDKAQIISQSLLDSIPGPVIAIDADMKITDINSMARDRFGMNSAALAALDYTAIFPDDPLHFRQVMESKRSASFEKPVGENRRQYFITTTPLVDFDGSLIGAIAIAQDITETRKIEAIAESRRRLSELGALAASMAHEIRNPLNAIGITIQRMRNEIKPAAGEEEYLKFLDGLRSEIRRLNDIIEKFLAVARSVRPEIAAVNIKELIGGAVEIFTNQARSQNINLKWEAPPDLMIDCDRASLTQALVNLIKNSIEAVQPGGNIEIIAAAMDSRARISVIDDGLGIADINLAMRPFHTTKKDGTGLGLATAMKILADHSGELLIESAPGKGCRVDMVLNKKRAEV